MNLSLRGIFLILALTAFLAPGVRYFNIVFTTQTRWGFLALLGIVLLLRGQATRPFESRVALALIAYFIWCVATYFWSNVPDLTLPKALAYVATATILIGAGQTWVSHWRPDAPLSYLLPVLLITLVAGIAGSGAEADMGGGILLYRGLSGNPNYLGMLVAASFPLAIYAAYRSSVDGHSALAQLISFAVILVLCGLLWSTASRSSLLCIMVTLAVFFSAYLPNTKIFVFVMAGFVAFTTPIVAPEIQEGVYTRLVVKGVGGDDIFYSRRGPWEESYQAAQQGGWMGLGLGVAAGQNTFVGGLSTSQTYGREKGNSQLAVWEELGLIGLALYAWLLISLISTMQRGLRLAQSQDLRIQLSLAYGLVLGMIAQSVFEAWWTAPGAPESAVFWSTVGVALALAERATASAYRQSDPSTPPAAPEIPTLGGAAHQRRI